MEAEVKISAMRSACIVAVLATASYGARHSGAEEFAWLAGDMVQVAEHRTDLFASPGPGGFAH